MEGCEGNSVSQLAESAMFSQAESEETDELRRIRQLIHRVQELTAERDEALEKVCPPLAASSEESGVVSNE